MLLIKCKCGCCFTLKEESLEEQKRDSLTCQNCRKKVKILYECDLEDIYSFKNSDFELYRIPNNFTVNAQFEF